MVEGHYPHSAGYVPSKAVGSAKCRPVLQAMTIHLGLGAKGNPIFPSYHFFSFKKGGGESRDIKNPLEKR